ncbi:MAG: porin, partial [Pseudomonadota bacterium]
FGGSVHYNMLGDGTELRYRQRPLVHFTDNHFLDTGRFSATSELGIGLEAAAISGPFHVAIEGYNQKVNRPGALANPSFLGGSAEFGYFLTKGDTRGYKIGKFDRVKPTNPVGEGGTGAVQVNLRYDYLDLNSEGVIGGTQDSLQASLIWTFTDYTRILLNYGLLSYDNAAFPTATGDTSYDVHVFGARAQFDF